MNQYNNNNDDENNTECVICFEIMKSNMACCPCGHVFHVHCLDDMMKATPRNRKCPMCRQPFSKPIVLYLDMNKEQHSTKDISNEIDSVHDIQTVKKLFLEESTKSQQFKRNLDKFQNLYESAMNDHTSLFEKYKMLQDENNRITQELSETQNSKNQLMSIIADERAKHVELQKTIKEAHIKLAANDYFSTLDIKSVREIDSLRGDAESQVVVLQAVLAKQMKKSKEEYLKLQKRKTQLAVQVAQLETENAALRKRDSQHQNQTPSPGYMNIPIRKVLPLGEQAIPRPGVLQTLKVNQPDRNQGGSGQIQWKRKVSHLPNHGGTLAAAYAQGTDQGKRLRSGINHLGQRQEFVMPRSQG